MKIHSIYETVSGEIGAFEQGAFCTVVRFSGCNLRCPYCDAKDSWWEDTQDERIILSPEEVVGMIKTKNVLITGGEPMYQPDALRRILQLLLGQKDKQYVIQVETNGTYPIDELMGPIAYDGAIHWVIDYKGKLPFLKENCLTGPPLEFSAFKEFVDRHRHLFLYGQATLKIVVAKKDIYKCGDLHYLFEKAPFARLAFSPMDADGSMVGDILFTCSLRYPEQLRRGQIIMNLQVHKHMDLP